MGEWPDSRGEHRLPQWSLIGGTPAAQAKFDCRLKQRTTEVCAHVFFFWMFFCGQGAFIKLSGLRL